MGSHYGTKWLPITVVGAHYSDHMLEDLVTTLANAQAIRDPAARAQELTRIIRKLPEIGAAIREARAAAVRELRADGWSHQQVADLLGVHRNRAAQIAQGVAGGSRRRSHVDAEPDDGE